MSWFSDFLEGTGGTGSWLNPGTLIGGPLGGLIYGEKGLDVTGGGAKNRLQNYFDEQGRMRGEAKGRQYDLLGQMKGPVVSPQMEARIKALEDESKAGPLAADPYFQGARSKLVRGGAQELASVANKQRGLDVSGGFQNTGSIQDVYDRLGGQLAQLGQKQADVKAAKRDSAAELRQGIADAQITYDNEILRAKMAIEAGDAAAAQDAMSRAYAAKEAIRARTQQMIMGAAQMGLSAFMGNPIGAAQGAKEVASAGPSTAGAPPMAQPDYWNNQLNSPLGITYQDKPWSMMRR